MNLSTLPQTPTQQDLLEITDFMCETGVVLKPVRQVLLVEAAKDPTLAKTILDRVGRHINDWNMMRQAEWRTWQQMSARAYFALQTAHRLVKLSDDIRAATAALAA